MVTSEISGEGLPEEGQICKIAVAFKWPTSATLGCDMKTPLPRLSSRVFKLSKKYSSWGHQKLTGWSRRVVRFKTSKFFTLWSISLVFCLRLRYLNILILQNYISKRSRMSSMSYFDKPSHLERGNSMKKWYLIKNWLWRPVEPQLVIKHKNPTFSSKKCSTGRQIQNFGENSKIITFLVCLWQGL